MRRRDFIKGITVSATWSVAARAQQTAETHRIALVHPSVSTADMSESGGNRPYVALFGELRRLGYIEGVNLVVARYSGEGREEHFLELCQEIAHTKPDVIVAASDITNYLNTRRAELSILLPDYGDFRFWHLADMPITFDDVRFWG